MLTLCALQNLGSGATLSCVGNPAVAGMATVPSGIGGMTQLNLNHGSERDFQRTTVTTNTFNGGDTVYFTSGGGKCIPDQHHRTASVFCARFRVVGYWISG